MQPSSPIADACPLRKLHLALSELSKCVELGFHCRTFAEWQVARRKRADQLPKLLDALRLLVGAAWRESAKLKVPFEKAEEVLKRLEQGIACAEGIQSVRPYEGPLTHDEYIKVRFDDPSPGDQQIAAALADASHQEDEGEVESVLAKWLDELILAKAELERWALLREGMLAELTPPTPPTRDTVLNELFAQAQHQCANSRGEVHIVAVPAGAKVQRCDEDSGTAGDLVDDRVFLPMGCFGPAGSANLGPNGCFNLLWYTPLNSASDGIEPFREFAKQAGTALMAYPPGWLKQPSGSPETLWVSVLLFLSEAAAPRMRECKGGGRIIRQSWVASLATIRDWLAEQKPTAVENEPTFVFRRDGENWWVRFGDERGSFPPTAGFRYLAQLLFQPGKAFSAAELKLAAGPGGNVVSQTEALDAGLFCDSNSDDPNLDEFAIKDLQKALVLLKQQESAARLAGDAQMMAAVQTKAEIVEQHLIRNTDKKGRPRRQDPQRSAFTAIKASIELVFTKFKEASPPLTQFVGHLDAAILRQSRKFEYRPTGSPYPWST